MKPERRARGKPELVADLKLRGIGEREAETFLDDFVDVATEALAAGDEVLLHLFGTFSVRQYAPRRVLNPRTKAPCYVPARRKARFRPSVALREALNGRKSGGGFGRG